jgi:hypothetical protein
VRVLESGPENVKTALKLDREVEVILGDAAKRPKGFTVAALQELGVDKEESLTVIKALYAIKTNKRGTGTLDIEVTHLGVMFPGLRNTHLEGSR